MRSHATASVRKWSPLELSIRSVFSRLSSVAEDDIQVNTTIYQLGLDSISAVQVASLLRKCGFAVSAVDVMEHSSCEGLAQVIGTKKQEASGAP